jgi:hypothetical protein
MYLNYQLSAVSRQLEPQEPLAARAPRLLLHVERAAGADLIS